MHPEVLLRSIVVLLALWSSSAFALDQGMYERYASSAYTYCDAEAVASAYRLSLNDAKI